MNNRQRHRLPCDNVLSVVLFEPYRKAQLCLPNDRQLSGPLRTVISGHLHNGTGLTKRGVQFPVWPRSTEQVKLLDFLPFQCPHSQNLNLGPELPPTRQHSRNIGNQSPPINSRVIINSRLPGKMQVISWALVAVSSFGLTQSQYVNFRQYCATPTIVGTSVSAPCQEYCSEPCSSFFYQSSMDLGNCLAYHPLGFLVPKKK